MKPMKVTFSNAEPLTDVEKVSILMGVSVDRVGIAVLRCIRKEQEREPRQCNDEDSAHSSIKVAGGD